MTLGLYEVLYEQGQELTLGEGFCGFSVLDVNKRDYREIYAFKKFCDLGLWRNSELSGLFSPRFFQKSGIERRQFFGFIEDNPDYDVYLFHPYPREISLANDFLSLAELEHPGIAEALAVTWRHVYGRLFDPVLLSTDAELCCHCNYFVASQRFWNDYSEFIVKFVGLMESDAGSRLREHTPYTLSRTDDVTLPLAVFVFERALTLFLKFRINAYRIVGFPGCSEAWAAPEVFDGEIDLVEQLSGLVESMPESRRHVGRDFATHAYYYFRKLKVMGDE